MPGHSNNDALQAHRLAYVWQEIEDSYGFDRVALVRAWAGRNLERKEYAAFEKRFNDERQAEAAFIDLLDRHAKAHRNTEDES